MLEGDVGLDQPTASNGEDSVMECVEFGNDCMVNRGSV